MTGKIKIYEQGTSTHPGDLITEEPFECYKNTWHDIKMSEPVPIFGDEDIWVSCEVTHDCGEYPAGMDPSCNYPGKGDWITLGSGWNEVSIYGFHCDWNLWAGLGPLTGYPFSYIKPGTQDINVTVENCGTFPELDLNCSAKLYEYITNCTNGTLVYEDSVTDINLNKPLGGTEILNFNNYYFAEEGTNMLNLNMPNENDDIPDNNEKIFGIIVDDSSPYSVHKLNPASPDGYNGWYVKDVWVTIDAVDPIINCSWGSGIKEIRYKIGNGNWMNKQGDQCTFIIDEDGEDILVQYYAIDWVENEEEINSFTINMDQTEPDIDFIYEFSGNYIEGWDFAFTATATDETSGMSRVEFFLNDLIQDTIYGPGPTYQWVFKYNGDLNIIVKAIGYDSAGNFATDVIVDPENIDYSQKQLKSTKQTQIISKSLIKILCNLEI
jgi:hypothetical protein